MLLKFLSDNTGHTGLDLDILRIRFILPHNVLIDGGHSAEEDVDVVQEQWEFLLSSLSEGQEDDDVWGAYDGAQYNELLVIPADDFNQVVFD